MTLHTIVLKHCPILIKNQNDLELLFLYLFLFFIDEEDPWMARKTMQDALQLRLSLVGGVFDTVCRNSASVTEWCTLMVQLIVR